MAVALTAIGSTSGGAAKPAAPVRAPALNLTVLGHTGEHISLAQYAGRPLIINFFASWCAPCQRETPLLARYYRSLHGRVTIIGVDANDSTSAGLAFMRRMGVSYPVAADPAPMRTTLSYGVTALPQTFFLDAQHRVVKRVIRAVTLTDLRTGVAMITKHAGRG